LLLRRRFLIAFVLVSLHCGGRTVDSKEGGPADGAGGTNATTSTGGSGGAGGAGGSGAAAGGSGGSAGNCGCVTDHVEWGMDGGNALFFDTSSLDVCSTFIHQRTSLAPNHPAGACKQEVSNCAGVVSASDVTIALGHADVRAATALPYVLFGEDTRPVDGVVFRMEVGTSVIEVGQPCRATSCKPIPAGVESLVTLLRQVTKEQLGREPCRSAFPTGVIEPRTH
jgi:hypothetical protein